MDLPGSQGQGHEEVSVDTIKKSLSQIKCMSDMKSVGDTCIDRARQVRSLWTDIQADRQVSNYV